MSQLTNQLSKVGSLIVAFGGIDVSTSADLRSGGVPQAVTLGHVAFNVLGSIEEREVQGSFPYTTPDGLGHNLTFTTKQKNDGSDTVSIDGVALTNAVVDNDLHWETDVVQFRGNDASGVLQEVEITVTVGIAQKVIAKIGGVLGRIFGF